ncbi:hypothetical protein [Mucilaginibacter dorajii]|uniref:Lipoprotein n=1 Tax=Mucilaginibacter dorajii TaxID=692994 RepID=A0ABP7Q8V8_9SPHI|nr:hypothetical protein [Mucilaginibacter dorajii]MCS3737067.1 hypothetical protein [Mucilaginibacter dorajii]
MKKRINNIIVLGSILFCAACSRFPVENNWSRDKEGCLGLRNKALADSLINQYQLMGKSETIFLKVFKSPNDTEHVDDDEILVYYWGGVCEGHKLVTDGDKCYAKFYFKASGLAFVDFTCE